MTIKKADRKAWASTCTLTDVGELTAQWLEGRISSVPGFCGAPDEETLPLVPVLARLNRAGYVTDCSQPGEIDDCCGGGLIEQRAAVQGYASPQVAGTLIRAAETAGLVVVSCSPAGVPRWRYGYGPSVTVTQVNGLRFTGFGVRIPRRHIRDPHIGYGECGREAVDVLCSAWQVTVIDPEWGRDDLLWDVLDGALIRSEAVS